jgi:hypothetical protein
MTRHPFFRITATDAAIIFGAVIGLLLSLPVGGPLN